MAASHVELMFLLRRSLPQLATSRSDAATGSTARITALDICLAAEETSGRETITGAQDIRGLWRTYPANRSARDKLLMEGISLRGHSLSLYTKTLSS